jgi:glycerol kinase
VTFKERSVTPPQSLFNFKVGITGYTTKSHICRAILESIAFQTKAVLEAMRKDSGHGLKQLNVDGGLSQSQEMMQIQADTLTISIHRPEMTEITALGAAIAAGLATGVWKDMKSMEDAFADHHREDRFDGKLDEKARAKKWELWEWGVEKSFGWVKEELEELQDLTDGTKGANGTNGEERPN